MSALAPYSATQERAWRAAVLAARTLVAKGLAVNEIEVAAFGKDARRLKLASFPSRGEASAAPAAEAFLASARPFTVAAPHRRPIFAPALGACAVMLDRVLDASLSERVSGRANYGERD
jgi:hypothetical protein